MNTDIASQILTGVISNAMYALGADAVRRSTSAAGIFTEAQAPALEQAISDAVSELTAVDAIRADLGGERLRAFLKSPEVKQLGRQAFALEIEAHSPGNEHSQRSLDELNASFVYSLKQWTNLGGIEAQQHGTRLFHAFLNACDDALSRLVQRGLLDAADARAAMNTRRVIGELTNLRHLLELQRQATAPNLDDILDFATLYRRLVSEMHTQVALPSLENYQICHVNQIYVKPSLRLIDADQIVPYETLLPLEGNMVILGDPGSGKSTLISKLVADMGAASDDVRLTTIVVVLRDYAAEKERTNCSITDFMGMRAVSKYQLPTPPAGAFEYLLRTQRAVILFDGLDELLEVGDRRNIVEDVEAFRRLYPTVTTLVTSRKVGYEEAPLMDDEFRHIELTKLTTTQVEAYARLSLGIHMTVEPIEREDLCAAFMAKSASLADLRGNPLLLGLLLERYVKTRNLPAHRVKVIESCALMLFERWDSDRSMPVRFPFVSKLRPAVANIAFDIYSSVQLQQGVQEPWLIQKMTDYLLGRKYEDVDEATAEAREFVSLCRGRTWVFSAIGATASGDELYTFTHRTFMEYFVAVYLARQSASLQDLVTRILPRITRQEWDEACQISVYLAANQTEEGPDKLLRQLLPKGGSIVHREETNRVMFCTRALATLVPDKLETVTTFLETWMHTLVLEASGEAVSVLLSALVNADPENQVTLARGLPAIFTAVFSEQPRAESKTWLLELGLHLPRFLSPHFTEESRELWANAGRTIAEENSEYIVEFGASRLTFANSCVFYGISAFRCHVDAWGPGALFVGRSLPIRPLDGSRGIRAPSLAETILAAATWSTRNTPTREREAKWALACLQEFGEWAIEHVPVPEQRQTLWQLPGISDNQRPHVMDWIGEPTQRFPICELTAEQLFAASCMVFALVEQSPAWHASPATVAADSTLFEFVATYVARRYSPEYVSDRAAPPGVLSAAQQDVLNRWSARTFSFTS